MSTFKNITDILQEGNRDDTDHRSIQALSNASDLEIRNMLKQVDTMIHKKKLRWDSQKQELENKVRRREQEVAANKAALEQKALELDRLHKQVTDLELQLGEVNREMAKMKREMRRSASNTNFVERKSRVDQSPLPTSRGFSSRDNTPDSSSSHAGASSQTFTLRNHFQEQPHSRPAMMRSASKTSLDKASTTTKRSSSKTRDTLSLESEILRLNAQLDEHKRKEREMFQELEDYKRANQEAKRKLDELAKRHSEHIVDPQSDKILKENSQNAGTSNKSDNIELQFYKDEVKKCKLQEMAIRNEMEQIRSELIQTSKRLEGIVVENAKLVSKASVNEEKAKLFETFKKKYQLERDAHEKEIERLKIEMASHSRQLAERNTQIKAFIDRAHTLEDLLKEKEAELLKVKHDLVVSGHDIDGLRLENEFLHKKTIQKDVMEINEYHKVLENREKENKRLKKEVITLTERLQELQTRETQRNKSTSSSVDLDNRRVRIQLEEYEKKLDMQRQHYDMTVTRLNNELEKLRGEKIALEAQLDNNNNHAGHFKPSFTKGVDSLSAGLISPSHLSDNLNYISDIEEQRRLHTANEQFRATTVNGTKQRAYSELDNNLVRDFHFAPSRHNDIGRSTSTENSDIEQSKGRYSLYSELERDHNHQRRKKELAESLDNHIGKIISEYSEPFR